MVKKSYLLAAKKLTDMNRNRLNTKRSPKEQERDELFYWIMSRLESSVQGCWPAKTSNSVTVEEDIVPSDNHVLLKHGRVSHYFSRYCTGEEFYSVMQEVANVFNEIGKTKVDGCSFYAVCHIKKEQSSLTVVMTTI